MTDPYLYVTLLSHTNCELRYVLHNVVQVVIEARAQAKVLVDVVKPHGHLRVFGRAAHLFDYIAWVTYTEEDISDIFTLLIP